MCVVVMTTPHMNNNISKNDNISDSLLEEQFNAGVELIRNLPKNSSYTPSNEVLLKFYAWFKQATIGKCNTPRPGIFDPVGRAKHAAWMELGDMASQEAKQNYVNQLKQMIETMPMTEPTNNFADKLGPDFYELVDLVTGKPISSSISNTSSSTPNGFIPNGHVHGSDNKDLPERGNGAFSEDGKAEEEIDSIVSDDDETFCDSLDTVPANLGAASGSSSWATVVDGSKAPFRLQDQLSSPKFPEPAELKRQMLQELPKHLNKTVQQPLCQPSTSSVSAPYANQVYSTLQRERTRREGSDTDQLSSGSLLSALSQSGQRILEALRSAANGDLVMNEIGQQLSAEAYSLRERVRQLASQHAATGPFGVNLARGGDSAGISSLANGSGASTSAPHALSSSNQWSSEYGAWQLPSGASGGGSGGWPPPNQFSSAPAASNMDPTSLAIMRLQQDMNTVFTRMNTLEALTMIHSQRLDHILASLPRQQAAPDEAAPLLPLTALPRVSLRWLIVLIIGSPFALYWLFKLVRLLMRRRSRRY